MFNFQPRHVLPAATLLAGLMFLASAVPHASVPVAAPTEAASLALLRVEVQDCVARTGRSRDECLDEAEGKALIQRAERLAQAQPRHASSRTDELQDEIDTTVPAPRSRSSIQ